MVLNKSALELTKGHIGVNKFSSRSARMHRHYCSDCGTALWFSSPEYEGIVALKPGTLDDTSSLRPIAHMWYRSAQPWLKIGKDVPIFQEQPSFSELLELSKKTHGT